MSYPRRDRTFFTVLYLSSRNLSRVVACLLASNFQVRYLHHLLTQLARFPPLLFSSLLFFGELKNKNCTIQPVAMLFSILPYSLRPNATFYFQTMMFSIVPAYVCRTFLIYPLLFCRTWVYLSSISRSLLCDAEGRGYFIYIYE
ncbi:hypothetical protein E1B28_007371 [Marasmius oreades]|uniref:Uncharacterized protein n=1 Tax=Marasmius oreades TaxID=181124 RepID=A0A9P7S1P8_9AGAR|nr:uncharacterized protein E1B28_007371 [Marasmius oreades]KAG7093717.1 hypothetical protein E1B28_007371 [Marasmius oreades]